MMFFGSGALDGAHHLDRTVAGFHHQEIHVVQTHAVRAGAGAVQAQGAVRQLVVQGLGHFALFRQDGVDQVAEVDVATWPTRVSLASAKTLAARVSSYRWRGVQKTSQPT